MKRIAILVLVLIGLGLKAQNIEEKVYRHSIKFAPFRMVASTLAIGYEYQLSDTYSMSLLSMFIYDEKQADYELGFVQDLGFKMSTPHKVDVLGLAPSLFFMPYLQYGSFNFRDARVFTNYEGKPEVEVNDHIKFKMYGGGILVGAGINFGKKFYMQAFFGGGIKINSLDTEKHSYYGINDLWLKKGIEPKGGFELGFKF